MKINFDSDDRPIFGIEDDFDCLIFDFICLNNDFFRLKLANKTHDKLKIKSEIETQINKMKQKYGYFIKEFLIVKT